MKKVKTKVPKTEVAKTEHPEVDMLNGFQTELEAVKVAWEIPLLTLEAEHMWELLKETKLLLTIPKEKDEMVKSYLEMIVKIDQLEERLKSDEDEDKDDFDAREFVNKICK